MKTTKDEILLTALRLFAARGFDAVSTGMIAGELGITKGALYRHYESKQAIFDSIIQRMFELDEQRANEDNVPAAAFEDDPAAYRNRAFPDLREFTVNQLAFWTEDPFAAAFRRMITIEQYKSEQAQKLYQDIICRGPVDYTADLFREMRAEGRLNDAAAAVRDADLAFRLFAPLRLAIELADGGAEKEALREMLARAVRDFETAWIRGV